MLHNTIIAFNDGDGESLGSITITYEVGADLNDLVELLSETTFRWLGRADRVVNSGGVKIFPETLESKLSSHIKNRFFLAGIPDPELGERLVMVVEGRGEATEILEGLKRKKLLEKHQWPKAVYFTDTFAQTGSGKVDRLKTLERILPSNS